MFTLPRKFFFALEAVLYIACHPGTRPISGKEICAKHGLTARYLEPIMQQLVHAGVLRGVRGPKGGYVLARDKRKITAGEIFQLVNQESQEFSASALGNSVILPLWGAFEAHVLESLQQVTLEELCKQAEEKGALEGLRKASDFVI